MKENDVESKLQNYFIDQGYAVRVNQRYEADNKIDIIAENDDSTWLIEVKGDYDKQTAQYNVNFDTAVGQIIKSITSDQYNYGIAIPITRTLNGERFSYFNILRRCHKFCVNS